MMIVRCVDANGVLLCAPDVNQRDILSPGVCVVCVMVGVMSIISLRFPLSAVTTGASGALSGAKLPVRLYLTCRIR